MTGLTLFALCTAATMAPAQGDDDSAQPQDALWKMAACANPGMSYPVKRQRLQGRVEVLYDITVDGEVENIRVQPGGHDASMDDYIIRALGRWSYFGYVQDGALAARHDVKAVFTYGPDKSKSCTHTSLPPLPSTLGDPANPYQNLKQCQVLVMPKKAARRKTVWQARLQYDISADGSVSNIRVTDPTPDDSIKAALTRDATNRLEKWKYTEFITAGEAMARPDMTATFYYGKLPDGAPTATHKMIKVLH